jgi:hypothetical protein
MIHSRPGFASRKSDTAPAKLNQDMVPALHRKPKVEEPTPLKQTAREVAADLLHEQMVKEAQAIAQRAGPEILVNPHASATPKTLEPGK